VIDRRTGIRHLDFFFVNALPARTLRRRGRPRLTECGFMRFLRFFEGVIFLLLFRPRLLQGRRLHRLPHPAGALHRRGCDVVDALPAFLLERFARVFRRRFDRIDEVLRNDNAFALRYVRHV
jgi:hypothetical protein